MSSGARKVLRSKLHVAGLTEVFNFALSDFYTLT